MKKITDNFIVGSIVIFILMALIYGIWHLIDTNYYGLIATGIVGLAVLYAIVKATFEYRPVKK